jgi:hypothetical protein
MCHQLYVYLFFIIHSGVWAQNAHTGYAEYTVTAEEYVEDETNDEQEHDADSDKYHFILISEQVSFTPVKRQVKETTQEKFKNDSDFWYVEKGKEKAQQQDLLLEHFLNALAKLFRYPVMKILVWTVVILIFISFLFWIAGLDYAILFAQNKTDRKPDKEKSTDWRS